MHVWTASALAVVALAAGCGGGGAGGGVSSQAATTNVSTHAADGSASNAKQRYVRQMRTLGITLSNAIALASQSNSDTKPGTDAANLVKVQRALARAAVGLRAITPPASVQADHRLLLTGVLEYEAELNSVIRRLRRGEGAALHSITKLRGLRDMKRASDAILGKGYAIVP